MLLRRLSVRLADRLRTDAVRLFAESTAGELFDWAKALEGSNGGRS